MRRSMSRTASRYSSSLRRSAAPTAMLRRQRLRLEAELERRELRVLAKFPGGDLIGGDPELKIGARRLQWMHAGEERRGRASMVARAVAQCPAGHLREAAEDVELLAV